jgi:predicted transposase/invertase (TIGR01784 family)
MISKYLDPKNDLAFKKIFGQERHKRIPIAFLNAVFNLQGKDEIVELEFLNTVQPPEIEARKESIVDVLVKDQRGAKYIVEMQVAKIAGFEKRAQYYAAKTYCAHFNAGDIYENLRRVIFLAITSYEVFPDKKHYKSDHEILDRETHENNLKDFSFTFVELPKFNKTADELETLEDKWYYFLKHAEESSNIESILAENPAIREAYTVLERTRWNESELYEYERVAMAVSDARSAFLAAEREGLERGLEQGLAQGLEQGRDDERKRILANLLSKGLSAQEVAELTGLSMGEIQR